MNLQASVLLSDEFAEFSGKVTALHERKKELKSEFKKLYEEHKAAVAAIDAEAVALQNAFTIDDEEKPEPPANRETRDGDSKGGKKLDARNVARKRYLKDLVTIKK